MPAKTEKNPKTNKGFFSEVKSELKKVHWPTKDELMDHTVTVIVLVLLTGVFIYLLDSVLAKIIQKIIGL